MKNLQKILLLEMILILIALFFTYRELGTFPAAWEDDSIFMLVARMFAEGYGYTLPILEQSWRYPYVIGIGPTVILPSSMMIFLFGFSVAIARISAGIYLLGTFILVYLFTKKNIGRFDALGTTALMITLSALVNTGKIVMGEVPGLFFFFAGALLWKRAQQSYIWSIIIGILFGMSVVSKITMGIIYPAFVLCMIIAFLRREWIPLQRLIITTATAVITFLLWKGIEITSEPSMIPFILERTGGGSKPPLQLLFENPQQLLRMPFIYFGGMYTLGTMGLWSVRKKLPAYLAVFIAATIVLCVIYFLSNEGWYRHILPAHILLLPFVPMGAKKILGTKGAILIILLCTLAQGWWQLTYHGSSKNPEAQIAANILDEQYADTRLIIRHAEIFVRYPHNPNWYFLPLPEIESYSPPRITQRSVKTACLPEVWKITIEQQVQYGSRFIPIYKRFGLLYPEENCKIPYNKAL